MSRKKKTKEGYFTQQTQQAIIQYNESESQLERNKLFSEFIFPALDKLTENIIHNRKYYDYGDDDYSIVKANCITYMTERLCKFDKSKDKNGKAFSFFNRVAINYLLGQRIKIKNERYIKEPNLSVIDSTRDISHEIYMEENKSQLADFCNKWSNWGILNIHDLYSVNRDKQIAESIFNLFKNVETIELFNRKALYIMIREQVDCESSYIRPIVEDLKLLFYEMYQDYLIYGTKNFDKYDISNKYDLTNFKQEYNAAWLKWLTDNNYIYPQDVLKKLTSNKKVNGNEELVDLYNEMYIEYKKSGTSKWKYYEITEADYAF